MAWELMRAYFGTDPSFGADPSFSADPGLATVFAATLTVGYYLNRGSLPRCCRSCRTVTKNQWNGSGFADTTLKAVMRAGIVGAAGAIGRAAAAELDRRGIPFRVIGRDRAKLEAAFGGKAEIRPADINGVAQALQAISGLDTIIYTVGVPYPQFALHPVFMRNMVEAARRAGVSRLAVVSSVYSYGAPVTARVAETHPREPEARKGRLRKEQEDIALAADGQGNLRTFVLRLPDFYGPHAELSLADQVFRGAMEGKAANWIGSPDLPHEFVYVPDTGPVLGARSRVASSSPKCINWRAGSRSFVASGPLCFGSVGCSTHCFVNSWKCTTSP